MTQYTRLIAFRVDDATHRAYHDAARQQGATVSDILRSLAPKAGVSALPAANANAGGAARAG